MNSDRFNEVYKQFISNINKKFKLGEKELLKEVEKNLDENSNYYIDLFIKNLLSHIDEVSACNLDFFKYNESKILLCDNLEFKEVINKLKKGKKTDTESFHKICTYIMTLYLVLLKDENKIEKYINANYCDYESYSQMISVINSKDNIVQNWKDNNNDKENEENIKKKEEEEKERMEKENKKKQEAKNKTDMPFPFGDIENTQIGKLAGELAEKIENDGDFEVPNITNPSDIFSMMFSGKKDNPIGKIMSTVCNELDSKIKNGEVDQSKLFNEAQGLMGSNGLFNPEDMMKNMPNMPNMPNMQNDSKDDNENENKNKIKIKRKKKGKKGKKNKKNINNVDSDNIESDNIQSNNHNKMMEEAFNEVINE